MLKFTVPFRIRCIGSVEFTVFFSANNSWAKVGKE